MTDTRRFKTVGGEWPEEVRLAATTRGGVVENVHWGRVCVVRAEDGEVVAAAGDPEGLAFWRSTAKPVQALPALRAGLAQAYGLEERHLALLCASHRGSPEQVAALEELMRLAGLSEEALVVRPTLPPRSGGSRDGRTRRDVQPRKLFHPCAGKHLGVLAWCKLQGWPLAGYTQPEHPAQREIIAEIASWAGLRAEELRLGRDGCDFPAPAAPLRRIAWLYAKLAIAEEAPAAGGGSASEQAAARAVRAMRRFPELVEGPGRLASVLLADGGIVAKSGAQGVFALGLREQRLGVAIQIGDGAESAWPPVVGRTLDLLGAWTPALREAFDAAFPAAFANDAGEPAGRREAVFTW